MAQVCNPLHSEGLPMCEVDSFSIDRMFVFALWLCVVPFSCPLCVFVSCWGFGVCAVANAFVLGHRNISLKLQYIECVQILVLYPTCLL